MCNHVDPYSLSNLILLGDFNVNYLETSHPLFSKLLLLSNSLSLTQCVTFPTHTTSTSTSLIDLVFLSSPSSLLSCESTPPLSNSDHLGIAFAVTVDKRTTNLKRSKRRIWRYALADFDRAQEMLNTIDWEDLFKSNDVNTCWSIWHTKFLQIMEACIPQLVLKKRKNLPWLTKPVIQAMRKRNAYFHAAKKDNCARLWTKYKTVRNKVVALLRRSKRQYFYNLKYRNHKELWKAVKLINKRDTNIPALWDGHTLLNSNADKANLLNQYFYDCFNRSFPPLSTPTALSPSECPESIQCTEDEVTDLLNSLNPAKSTGLDGVSAIMLKSTALSIAPSLTKLFNLSIATGCFPTEWKQARITPIHKASDSSLPKNYRPISILPIVSKLLERHIHSLIIKHLYVNQPISTHQWGFMPKRSTTSALCSLTHDWHKQLDEGCEVCSVFFDIKKAFDSVPHIHLMNKLSTLQLNTQITRWLHSYLAGRSQVVAVGGEQSSAVAVVSGVPQGSVLGPLLFIIYIDNITSQISSTSTISLFADDIALYRTIRSPADYVVLQADITAITVWIENDNHLKLNVDKCCLMLVSREHTLSLTPPPLFIHGDSQLQQVNSVKYLGLLLTSDLTWSQHINNICSKTRKLTGLFYRRFHHCHPQLMLRLYKSLVRPHLEYASQVWDPHLNRDVDSLENVQKFALRVCQKSWSAPYHELLNSTNVHKLSTRRKNAKLCQLYKIIYGLTDCESNPVIVKPTTLTRHRNPVQLQQLRFHSSQFQFSFYPHSISMWNKLTLTNDSLASLSLFKHSITS